MKRILTLTLCCLGAAALLVSCGGNAAKKAAKEAEKAAADSVAAAEQTQRTMEKIAQLPAEPVFDIITSMGVIINIKGANNSPNLDKLAWYVGNCGQNYTSSAGCDVSNGYDISGWSEKQYAD